MSENIDQCIVLTFITKELNIYLLICSSWTSVLSKLLGPIINLWLTIVEFNSLTKLRICLENYFRKNLVPYTCDWCNLVLKFQINSTFHYFITIRWFGWFILNLEQWHGNMHKLQLKRSEFDAVVPQAISKRLNPIFYFQ